MITKTSAGQTQIQSIVYPLAPITGAVTILAADFVGCILFDIGVANTTTGALEGAESYLLTAGAVAAGVTLEQWGKWLLYNGSNGFTLLQLLQLGINIDRYTINSDYTLNYDVSIGILPNQLLINYIKVV